MKYFDVHTHKMSTDCHTIYNASYPYIPLESDFSLSFHPWNPFPFEKFEDLMEFSEKLQNNAYWKAVGECGLDYKRGFYEIEMQNIFFKWQIELANRFHKPLIIHCVKAWHDLFSIIKPCKTIKIIHAFLPTNHNTTEVLKDPSIFISIGQREIRHPNFSAAIQKIPIHRIFAETDEDPIDIKEVYKAIANAKKIPIESFIEEMEANRLHVFQR